MTSPLSRSTTHDDILANVGDEAGKIAAQLQKEGGRGAVLLGAARLDLACERLLKGIMHSNPKGEDNLFDPDRALGTFSAKIALAYRLSLIDKDTEHALQMIRKVRNHFAHSFEDATLQHPAHVNRLRRPLVEAKKLRLWATLAKLYEGSTFASTPEVLDYILLVVCLVSYMETAAHLLSPSQEGVIVCLSKGLVLH